MLNHLDQIFKHKLVAILRGMPAKDTIAIANALYDGGIRVLEVTLNSDRALELIELLSETFKEKMLIGAGTVLDNADAINAIAAGASFLISPSTDIKVINTTKKAGRISIPGAFTATEILTAHNNGADIVKVFPAPDATYIKNMLAPLNHVRLMPTGGIDETNIKAFAATGAVAFGIGSALVKSGNAVDNVYLGELTARAERLIATLNK